MLFCISLKYRCFHRLAAMIALKGSAFFPQVLHDVVRVKTKNHWVISNIENNFELLILNFIRKNNKIKPYKKYEKFIE